MGIMSSLFNAKSPTRGPTDDYWYVPMLGKVGSGVDVNEYNSLNYSAVFQGILFISQTIASLPYHLMRRLPRGKEKAIGRLHYDVIHNVANDYMPSMTFWETLIAHIVSWGNGYAEIQPTRAGSVGKLWPIPPNRIEPVMRDGELVYDIQVGNETITLPRKRILHIPGLGFDGYKGYSVLTMAREAIGMGIAAEQFSARFYGQGAHPGMVVTHPKTLGAETHRKLQTSMGEKYEGLGHAHRMMLLDEGMNIEKVGLSQKDAQFVESRTFQIDEISRWLNLPPHILNELQYGSYSNVETMGRELVIYRLRPWMTRIEQHCNLQLLSKDTRKAYYHKFNDKGLLRGDTKTQSEFYKAMWDVGGLTTNEIRDIEDFNPIEGGDTPFVNTNARPLDKAIAEERDNADTAAE